MSQIPMRDPPEEEDSGAKRRKIRKGTHSCWECRRRKTRCQFDSSTAEICIGCKARGTTCVSQEFPDEQPQASERGLSQRLSRVEGLLERLVEHITPRSYSPDERYRTSSASAEDEPDSSAAVVRRPAGDQIPDIDILEALYPYSSSNTSSFVRTPSSTQTEAVSPLTSRQTRVAKILHASFPSKREIDAILAADSSAYFIVTYFNGIDEPSDPPCSVSEVPPETSHPALLAKRLMQIVMSAQKISCHAFPPDIFSKEAFRPKLNRYVSLVSELVASNDDLVGSVEGLETLFFIGLYHGNAGNLRKSWLALRRAHSVALLMGLDKWPDHKPIRSVDPQSNPSTRTKAMSFWYRINLSDRYLSLLLGLPAASEDDNFASPEHMAHLTPCERIERLHSVVTKAIIKRNLRTNKAAVEASFGTTQAIDCDLEQAARSIGEEWWRPIEPIDVTSATASQFVRTHTHIMMQLNHHHLLILLHLPYMMRDPKERRWDYSKTTCLHASRELLRVYLIYRNLTDAAYACRHVDYGSLTAAMTLLLGYLDPRLRARDPETSRQRDIDRELVVAVRDIMKGIATREDDKLSRETSDIITRLLPLIDINQTMAGNGAFSTPVQLEIPFLGTININPISRREGGANNIAPAPTTYSMGESIGYPEQSSAMLDSAHQVPDGLDGTSIDTGLQQQASQVFPGLMSWLGEESNFSFMQFEPDISSPYQFPELAADVDQWTFQGFDANFFESLMPPEHRPPI
ncbi:hypothetical protein M426DRAFT_316375 [Hypoxylon sp. CI-4A]|nr:hypothetical protein M426DRAFT_316375 [Hypoxylon sp. CI-4A]